MSGFGALARRHFDFLIDDFGFALTQQDNPVRYDSDVLYVQIGSGQGDIDLLFGVKIDTDVLRPYLPHLFGLARVVRYFKTGPYPVLASFPGAPGAAGDERSLIHLATLTKTYCADILRGDITPFERLTRDPGATHASPPV